MDRRQSSQLTGGIILIALGVMFLSQRVWYLQDLSLHRLWPLFLIVPGAIRLLYPGEGRGGGLWLLFVGGIMLMQTYDVLPLQRSWPLFIIMGGVSMLFGHSHRRRDRIDRPTNADQPAAPQGR